MFTWCNMLNDICSRFQSPITLECDMTYCTDIIHVGTELSVLKKQIFKILKYLLQNSQANLWDFFCVYFFTLKLHLRSLEMVFDDVLTVICSWPSNTETFLQEGVWIARIFFLEMFLLYFMMYLMIYRRLHHTIMCYQSWKFKSLNSTYMNEWMNDRLNEWMTVYIYVDRYIYVEIVFPVSSLFINIYLFFFQRTIHWWVNFTPRFRVTTN